MSKELIFAERNYQILNYIVSNIGQPNSNINSDALKLLIEELKSKRYTGRIITEFNLNNLSENPEEIYDFNILTGLLSSNSEGGIFIWRF